MDISSTLFESIFKCRYMMCRIHQKPAFSVSVYEVAVTSELLPSCMRSRHRSNGTSAHRRQPYLDHQDVNLQRISKLQAENTRRMSPSNSSNLHSANFNVRSSHASRELSFRIETFYDPDAMPVANITTCFLTQPSFTLKIAITHVAIIGDVESKCRKLRFWRSILRQWFRSTDNRHWQLLVNQTQLQAPVSISTKQSK
jgi:hypothetical protein